MYSLSWFMLLFMFLSYSTLSSAMQLPIENEVADQVVHQKRNLYRFNGVTFTNNFSGARLSDVHSVNDSIFDVIISPENEPINRSPWYAFKVCSESHQDIQINLKYTYASHRYNPKVSYDGRKWIQLKSDDFVKAPSYRIHISSDTLWFAAGEVVSTQQVYDWVDSLNNLKDFIQKRIIGRSVLGKDIVALEVGHGKSENVLVILSRQHPPEVTGYFAMKAFIHELTLTNLYQRFNNQLDIIVIPLINPDGVELGHWRHNANGVDLNRDWKDFSQPETRSISEYLKSKAQNQKILFCIDFHSTTEDVFYVVTDDVNSITIKWLNSMEKYFQSSMKKTFHGIESATSKNWIYKEFNAEAVTYEVGDHTSRELINQVGRVAALELVNEMMTRLKSQGNDKSK